MTVLLATRNRHKVRELRRILRGAPVRFLAADGFQNLPAVREDGATFRANAVEKAVAASGRTILPVLAEDSGLEVRALSGRPGVRSARYGGAKQNDHANVRKLVREMGCIPASKRQARFVCVMALAIGGRLLRTFEGSCAGSIALQPAGRTGFGYDPVFIPRGYRKTMSQLGARVKDGLSHRRQAALRFRAWLVRARFKKRRRLQGARPMPPVAWGGSAGTGAPAPGMAPQERRRESPSAGVGSKKGTSVEGVRGHPRSRGGPGEGF